jgi:hypothetical protein
MPLISHRSDSILVVLCAVEILMVALTKWTSAKQRRILERKLQGKALDTLASEDREQVIAETFQEFSQTFYRKLELIVTTYHIPALASWVVLTGKRRATPWYYFGVSVAFWFFLVVTLLRFAIAVPTP